MMGDIPMRCFIDSSAFIALNHVADQNYEEAFRIANQLGNCQFIISDAVIIETYNILRYRLGFEQGNRFLQTVLSAEDYEIVDISACMRNDVALLLERFSEHKVSYCDALSVVIMRELKIDYIFAFDHHFRIMGLQLVNDLVS